MLCMECINKNPRAGPIDGEILYFCSGKNEHDCESKINWHVVYKFENGEVIVEDKRYWNDIFTHGAGYLANEVCHSPLVEVSISSEGLYTFDNDTDYINTNIWDLDIPYRIIKTAA